MSSKAKKVEKKLLNQRVNVTFQVLTILEEEARKKNFFQRFGICCEYLFLKRFSSFFKE